MTINKIHIDKNLTIIFGITLMSVVGIAGIYPALPLIADSLHIGKGKIGLLIAMYALPGILFTPLFGVLADRIGRKKILVPALILFGIAGGACALTNNFSTLLILRLFQGIGASSLGALNVTVIGDLYDNKLRFSAMGLNNSVLSFGTATFPLIGGGMAELSWNYPFLLPLLALPIAALAFFFLDIPEPRKNTHLKTYFKIIGESFSNFKITGLFIVSFLTFVILIGAFVNYVPVYVETVFKSSPFEIAVIVSSMSLMQSITASQLGKITGKADQFHLIALSFVLYATGLVTFLFIKTYLLLFIPAIIFGIGQGLNVPTLQSVLSGYISTEYRAAHMSVNRMVSLAGQFAGPVLMGMLFVNLKFTGVFLSASFLAALAVIIIIKLSKFELKDNYIKQEKDKS